MDKTTVEVYDRGAEEWREKRGANWRNPARAQAFASRVPAGVIRVDLGCGPGPYLPHLGEPVVALDAARAMLDLALDEMPGAMRVQGDIEALPFRDRFVGGAWAAMSYLHVRRERMALALAHLHWALDVGAPVHLDMHGGDGEEVRGEGDDFPGRYFSYWRSEELRDLLEGAGFDVTGIERENDSLYATASRARSLPDTVADGLDVLVCGLNPSIYSADRGRGFARPGNRFWPAALGAGLVTKAHDPRHALVHDNVGMTDLVKRATVAAKELTTHEYAEGVARVSRLVARHRPRAVCFVGLDGWRRAIDRRAQAGWQPDGFAGAAAYLMPSTSGLNAATSMATLVRHFEAVRR